jgi:ABC-type nitrate/sulfonate/bicarbonate transport system permease component
MAHASEAKVTKLGLRLRSLASVLLLVAAWELVARTHLTPPLFLPPFSTVAVQLWGSLADGTLVSDLAISLFRAFAGLALATVIGIFIGIVMARSRFLYWFADPLVALAFPSPKIAFIPVFILWFGIESWSKILLVTFACVFPIIIGSYSAAKAINRVLIWSASSLGASRRELLTHLILPACFPRIFATLRIALPVALITTFTAEMVAGGGGMGATLVYSQRFFDSPTVFAYIVVMLCVGLALDAAMLKFQSRYLRWAEQ